MSGCASSEVRLPPEVRLDGGKPNDMADELVHATDDAIVVYISIAESRIDGTPRAVAADLMSVTSMSAASRN